MRIVVIDDHVLFRRCIVDYLECQADITVAGQTSSPRIALDMIEHMQPDVALVDIDLGGQNGLTLAKRVLATQENCAVVILTASDSEQDMLAAVETGASGYLVKSIEPQALCNALHRVVEGDLAFPRDFLVNQLRRSTQSPSGGGHGVSRPGLSVREIEVLQLVTDGLMDKQIAHELSISENTVKKHLQAIRRKLGVANRLQASLEGIRRGVIRDRNNET